MTKSFQEFEERFEERFGIFPNIEFLLGDAGK